MNQQVYGQSFSGNAAENYQRYFVPFIGAPVADDLIAVADVQPGERVLDVACGTGVVTRRAAERVGSAGTVCGLDVNPAMLAVARSETPQDASIDWHEASADRLPFADGSFDLVLCQMGLQFFPSQLAALREMYRVLDAGGRAYVTVPGPKPAMFAVMTDALARHIGPDAASFGNLVFSLHDVDEMRELMLSAGFADVNVRAEPKTLSLPAPADFLWQYLFSTPIAKAVAGAGEHTREKLEREVCEGWRDIVSDGAMSLEVNMTIAVARK